MPHSGKFSCLIVFIPISVALRSSTEPGILAMFELKILLNSTSPIPTQKIVKFRAKILELTSNKHAQILCINSPLRASSVQSNRWLEWLPTNYKFTVAIKGNSQTIVFITIEFLFNKIDQQIDTLLRGNRVDNRVMRYWFNFRYNIPTFD